LTPWSSKREDDLLERDVEVLGKLNVASIVLISDLAQWHEASSRRGAGSGIAVRLGCSTREHVARV
jgi:hypothetical protein